MHMPDDQEVAPKIYRVPGGCRYTYPIDYSSVKDLIRGVLTVIEATGMNSQQTKAVKSLLNQAVYGWFEGVQRNAETAAPASGWKPMRVSSAGDIDIHYTGDGTSYRWRKSNDSRRLLRLEEDRRGPGTEFLPPYAVIEIEDTHHQGDSGQCSDDHDYRVRWVGPCGIDERPEEGSFDFMWAAIEHALTSAPPFFEDIEEERETIDSIISVRERPDD